MTPKEMQIAVDKFRQEVGPNADVSVFIEDKITDEYPVRVIVYPHGICRSDEGRVSIEAEDFPDALLKMRAAWDEHSAQFRGKAIRSMALMIIRITAEQGHCTDAALRQEFKYGEVERYGADAVKDANEIADKGPFAIVTLGGANGAPDEVPKGATVN